MACAPGSLGTSVFKEQDARRIIYAFDPRRQAGLILGGDKTGDKRFYEWIIPKAEAIWERYLEEGLSLE